MVDRKKDRQSKPGVSRRRFLGNLGAGAVGMSALSEGPKEQLNSSSDDDNTVDINIYVNGRSYSVAVAPRETLLDLLRDKLGLTGTKVGCGRGECGACTVIIDGLPRYACMTLAVEAQGKAVTTVEGLMDGEELGSVQQAFVEEDGYQCGYCTPGQVVAAEALLREIPDPNPDQIQEGMSGNLCRCGAYKHIIHSVERAVELKGASG